MMNKRSFLFSLTILLCGVIFFSCISPGGTGEEKLRSGDIIFQSGSSAQCRAVQAATHSAYSHCGIIFEKDGKFVVYEAVQPVRITSLEEWKQQGSGGKFVIRRLKNADEVLTPAVISSMQKIAEKYNGKNYDIYFGWSDERIYCSELVWKVYKQGAGIEVGKLQKLKEFDLSSEGVKKIMKERYGNNVPYEELVISPASVFASDLLETVAEK